MKLLLVIFVASVQVFGIASLKVTLIPEHKVISNESQDLSFTCAVDSVQYGCQFIWWDVETKNGPILDSPFTKAVNDRIFDNYDVDASSMDIGACGIALVTKNVTGIQRIIGCRIRTKKGGWKYAWADLVTYYDAPLPTNWTTPREAVVLPKYEAMFTWKAQEPLSNCWSRPAGYTIHPEYSYNTEDYYSTGAPLESGECDHWCNITVPYALEVDNGPLVGEFVSTTGKSDYRFFVTIVAHPPTAPIMTLKYTDNSVTATCFTHQSRPVANITWLLGEDVVRQDDVDDSPAGDQDDWRWPWSRQSILQTHSFELKPEDNGKELKCRVSHVALPEPLEERRKIVAATSNTTHCHPLTSQSVEITCIYATEIKNCSEPQHLATEAKLKCKKGFLLPTGVGRSKTITCRRNAEWSGEVFTCYPDCGRRIYNVGEPLSSNGEDATIGEFPWHIGIYRVFGNGSTDQICGGTILASKVAVTAAHCFWIHYGIEPNASSFKVAAGKYLRAWDELDPGVQKRNISNIVLHETYSKESSKHEYDIALIELEFPFDINARVNPVCVDWDNDFESDQLAPESKGVVAGWGFTEEGVQPDSLKYVELPFVLKNKCKKSLTKSLQSLLTPDKFCAGYVNRSISVCKGDSGGGLVFLNEATDKYYLRGIVSLAFAPNSQDICYAEHYTAFTMVSHYRDWMLENFFF